MKALYLALLMTFSASSAHAFDLGEKDKQLHMVASFTGTVVTRTILKHHETPTWMQFIIPPIAVFGIGYLKEKTDPGGRDDDDIKANVAGILTGMAFNLTF